MTTNEMLSKKVEVVASHYMVMAQYAARQCTGYSYSPMILAFKAQQAMLEAHGKGDDPIVRLNDFLGTSIPEDVLLSQICNER